MPVIHLKKKYTTYFQHYNKSLILFSDNLDFHNEYNTLSKGYDYNFYFVNANEIPGYAKDFHISRLPTFLFLEKGVEAKRVEGINPLLLEFELELFKIKKCK